MKEYMPGESDDTPEVDLKNSPNKEGQKNPVSQPIQYPRVASLEDAKRIATGVSVTPKQAPSGSSQQEVLNKMIDLDSIRSVLPPGVSAEHLVQAAEATPRSGIETGRLVGLLTEIPAGKDAVTLAQWVEDRIRTAEKEGDFTDPSFIDGFKQAVGNYEPVGGPPAGKTITEFRSELGIKLEARGYLYYANFVLGQSNYAKFSETVSGYFDKTHLDSLWKEQFGSPEQVVKVAGHIMEEGEGEYWREVPQQNPADPTKWDYYPPGTRHAQVDTYLAGQFPQDEETRKVVKNILEALFKTTGTASFYTGPVNPRTGRLVDLEIMEQVDNAGIYRIPGAPAYVFAPGVIENNGVPEVRYIKNEYYWDLWREYRLNGLSRFQDPIKPETQTPQGDPASTLRARFYPAEDFARTATTKTRSLWPRMELYTRSMPQMSGYKSLEAFMDSTKRTPNFRYGLATAGAHEAYGAMQTYLNEPIVGGESAGDLKKLDSTLKNMTELSAKLASYLKIGISQNMVYYAVSRLYADTFTWLNGASPDRRTGEFRLLPKFGDKLMNYIAHSDFFRVFMDDRNMDWALRAINASDQRVTTRRSNEGVLSALTKTLLALGEQILSPYYKKR